MSATRDTAELLEIWRNGNYSDLDRSELVQLAAYFEEGNKRWV